jgi:hypothetical protein
MFDVKYQLMLNDMAQMGSYIGDLAYFEQMQQYVSLLDTILTGAPQVNFRRHQHRLSWFSDMNDNDITAETISLLNYIRLLIQIHTLVFIMICL